MNFKTRQQRAALLSEGARAAYDDGPQWKNVAIMLQKLAAEKYMRARMLIAEDNYDFTMLKEYAG